LGSIKPNALEEIEISPGPVAYNSPVKTVTVTYDSFKGIIDIHWKKTESTYLMQITVPSATTARVIIPKHDRPYTNLKVHDLIIADFTSSDGHYFLISGINSLELQSDGSIFMRVQPGKYDFFASTV